MGTPEGREGNIGPESYPEGTYLPPLDSLRGATVVDADGDKVGTVDEVYVDESGTFVRYLGVSTGWFGMRRHVIPIDDVALGGAEDELRLPYDKDVLRQGPAFDPEEDLTESREREVYGHYGRPGYWEAVRARQETPAATPEIAEAEAEDSIARGEDPSRIRVRRWGV